MVGPYGVRLSGPLAGFVEGFVAELGRQGYTALSMCEQVRLVGHLSGWMAAQGVEPAALTGEAVDEFCQVRRAQGRRNHLTPQGLAPILEFLRSQGVAPQERERVADGPGDELLGRFRSCLLAERGLGLATADGYVYLVRPFVLNRLGSSDMDAVPLRLSAQDVMGFLLEQARATTPRSLQSRASALRVFLRFMHAEGLTSTPLAGAVPKVACRQSRLPRALPPTQVAALLGSCNTHTVDGLRDLAILTLLSRMGLRAGEVAALSLDDIDWRAGELTVHGKGPRVERLPLPVDVGETVSDYLRRARPAGALDRGVFIRVKAPHRSLTPTGVTAVVYAASRRAGLDPVGAHRLRHCAATAMLAAGAPLEEIGQVLCHRRAGTTAIYAGVDMTALAALVVPWPAGAR